MQPSKKLPDKSAPANWKPFKSRPKNTQCRREHPRRLSKGKKPIPRLRSSSRADQSTPERAQSAKSQESIWVARNLGAVILQPSNRQPENWHYGGLAGFC